MSIGGSDPVNLYEMQHRIWPGWAESDFGARQDADVIRRFIDSWHEGSMLDLGCGSGRLSCAMAEAGWQVDGIDISAEMIERADARATKRNLACPPRFRVADIREFRPPCRYDVVVLWDSVLAIWPWGEAKRLLAAAADTMVATGGWLVIGQLNPKYFAANPDLTSTFENPAIGPGRTARRYRFDAGSGLLRDDVTVYFSEKKTVALPTQHLHLVTSTEMMDALAKFGFSDLGCSGADGWEWPTTAREDDKTAAQIIVLGRKA